MKVGQIKYSILFNTNCIIECVNYLDDSIVWVEIKNKTVPHLKKHLK